MWIKAAGLDWGLQRLPVQYLVNGTLRTMTDRFVPEFTMVCSDGRALLNTTVWGDGTVSTIAIRPDRLRDQQK